MSEDDAQARVSPFEVDELEPGVLREPNDEPDPGEPALPDAPADEVPWPEDPPADEFPVFAVEGEETGGELPEPGNPMAVARVLMDRMRTPRKWWRGDFYQWVGTHWAIVEDAAVKQWLYQQTQDATYLETGRRVAITKPWAPTKKKIDDLKDALGVGALQRQEPEDRGDFIALKNGVLRLKGRRLAAHTPELFNLASLPFDYDPHAEASAWEEFLHSVLPRDEQAQEFLAEWFGYVLSGRTDQQKMAALIGPRRCGKGTIARVLTSLLGQDNTTGLDLNLVATTFGLENLLGKALAICGDIRWKSRNVADAVPVLLGVTGEDSMTVHRKHRTSWNGQLPTRFMLMSNDTPEFTDTSGALSGRMVYVKFSESFFGREDTSLTDKLLGELPGILNWALHGLSRLNARGSFLQPDSGREEAEEVRRAANPVGAFVEDACVVGPQYSIGSELLYLKYRGWCERNGEVPEVKLVFSRKLTATPELKDKIARKRVGQAKATEFEGIWCA